MVWIGSTVSKELPVTEMWKARKAGLGRRDKGQFSFGCVIFGMPTRQLEEEVEQTLYLVWNLGE